MKVIISYTYKEDIDEFNNVTSIEETFNYKLGASVSLKIDGKRCKVRISTIDIKHMTVIDKDKEN